MKKAPLLQLGFTDLEATVYLAVLKNGVASAVTIANDTGLPKTTVYDQLAKLVQNSCVHTYTKGNRKQYAASDPQVLIDKHKRNAELLDNYVPELRAQYIAKKHTQPRVRTYDSAAGIDVVIKELLAEEKHELLVLGSIAKEYELFAGNKRLEKVIQDRVKRKFRARHIVDDSPQARETQSLDQQELRITKIIAPEKPFTSLQYIWTNKVVVISPTAPVTITIIEDNEVYELQKNLFESLWRYHPEKPGTKRVPSSED